MQVTDSKVNIVNADLLAKKRGLRVTETVVPTEGGSILDELTVRNIVKFLKLCVHYRDIVEFGNAAHH